MQIDARMVCDIDDGLENFSDTDEHALIGEQSAEGS